MTLGGPKLGDGKLREWMTLCLSREWRSMDRNWVSGKRVFLVIRESEKHGLLGDQAICTCQNLIGGGLYRAWIIRRISRKSVYRPCGTYKGEKSVFVLRSAVRKKQRRQHLQRLPWVTYAATHCQHARHSMPGNEVPGLCKMPKFSRAWFIMVRIEVCYLGA